MGLNLPTDTAHLRMETRQYELMNRPIAQGIPRRQLMIGVVVGGGWALLMLLIGITPFTNFTMLLWVFPPFVIIFGATRKDESGRMGLLLWYDAFLSRFPRRRALIRNPLLAVGDYQPVPVRMDVVTLIVPRTVTAVEQAGVPQ